MITQMCCNPSFYYVEVYRPWVPRFPMRDPYAYFYEPYGFLYPLKQQTPFYFNAMFYPSLPTVHQSNNHQHQAVEPQAVIAEKMEEKAIEANKIEHEKGIQIETSKDSSSLQDKSLLVNIFDSLLGNRKAVNVLSHFPNFKITRASGTKTMAIQGLSVG